VRGLKHDLKNKNKFKNSKLSSRSQGGFYCCTTVVVAVILAAVVVMVMLIGW
jgi:hypothetical protein